MNWVVAQRLPPGPGFAVTTVGAALEETRGGPSSLLQGVWPCCEHITRGFLAWTRAQRENGVCITKVDRAFTSSGRSGSLLRVRGHAGVLMGWVDRAPPGEVRPARGGEVCFLSSVQTRGSVIWAPGTQAVPAAPTHRFADSRSAEGALAAPTEEASGEAWGFGMCGVGRGSGRENQGQLKRAGQVWGNRLPPNCLCDVITPRGAA